VSWNRNGTGRYKTSITVQSERGLGFYCWPDFQVLSDAQDFVEHLMGMTAERLMEEHRKLWPGVRDFTP
jgi:hypothetical protein